MIVDPQKKDLEASETSSVSSEESSHGLHWLMACVFIIGDMAGAGMIALPSAFMKTGFTPGILLVLFCALVTTNTATQLGKCWTNLQKRWPEKYLEKDCRKPYAEIAYRACGPWMRSFLVCMICLTQFGFCTVLVLLAAKNIAILLNFFFLLRINYCYLILIVGFLVWPATMLKSPMHFWHVAVLSAASSSIAVVVVLFGIYHDAPVCERYVHHNDFELGKFFNAYGTLVFAFGGHVAFPTIQHDMEIPSQFSRSVYLSFAAVLVYYLSVSIYGYYVYGSSVGDTIISSIQQPWIQQSVNMLIAFHVLTTIVIAYSPMVQQVEHLLRVPHKFGAQRFVARSFLFWIVIFAALSVPNFGPMMEFIGSSTMSLMCIILPSVFYLLLNASWEKRQHDIKEQSVIADFADDQLATWRDVVAFTPRPILIFNMITISFGIIGMVVASSASAMELMSAEVGAPCYVQYFRKQGLPFSDSSGSTINCCGQFHNITVSGINPSDYCSSKLV